MALTSKLTWNAFPSLKPAVVYEQGQIETRNFYFVQLSDKNIIVLQWHTRKDGNISQWEWPSGKIFHGDVIFWSEPVAP